jgi:HSP20 family protein
LPKDAKQVWSGMQYGTFQESFTLPAAINADAAEATLSDGMLCLHLPKADGTKATTIQIKSEQPQKKIEVDQAS